MMSPSVHTVRRNMLIRTTNDIGHLVRDQRKRQGLTQAHLATRVGVSRKWIIELESGKRTAELALVLRTLNALKVDLDAQPRDAGSATSTVAVESGGRDR